MSLSSASNTINALGIFGRLEPELERYFKNLSGKFSQYPENDDAIGTFNHLSIVMPTLFILQIDISFLNFS